MEIEIKAVKVHHDMSEETLCFSANLYVDGKKLCEISNRGCGGSHEYFMPVSVSKKLNDWCKANLPKWSMIDGEEMDTDFELHISHLVDEYDKKKTLKSLLKRKIVVVDDVCKYAESYQWKLKKFPSIYETYGQIKKVMPKFKNPICLNLVEFDTAYQTFYKESQS
tara:strand:+ start:252 stop:749 length:498 start_codon:yes stop_codon:yes gene_type:complete